LEPIDAEPGAADRGTKTHQALEHFVRRFPDRLPTDALAQLLALGEQAFGELLDRPAVRAFWWPRFERIAAWYIEQENLRRVGLAAIHAEVKGTLEIAGLVGPFRLTATADRIERGKDGCLCIIDYKTGVLPGDRDLELGMSPQLPLEAAIAAFGEFQGVAKGALDSLAFWRLTGGDPAGLVKPVKGDLTELADRALDGLKRLVVVFDRPDTPYRSLPDPSFAPRYSDYAHLARVKEWSAGTAGDGE
ncbi:MAG: PD-(D/E)XK nuclease family protein, partial [Dongiaceae bacterium]